MTGEDNGRKTLRLVFILLVLAWLSFSLAAGSAG
jgi:hypothetical protein